MIDNRCSRCGTDHAAHREAMLADAMHKALGERVSAFGHVHAQGATGSVIAPWARRAFANALPAGGPMPTTHEREARR